MTNLFEFQEKKMTKSGGRKVMRLDFPKRLLIAEKLRETCSKNEKGFAEYKPGWSDLSVANFLGEPIKSENVKLIRQSIVGPFYKHKKGPSADTSESRLDKLERELRDVTDYLTSRNSGWRGA
jgi:hypothetical protein